MILVMKFAISVPDTTFCRVENRAAALYVNRSEIFSRAAERYPDGLDAATLTHKISAALDRGGRANTVAAAGLARLHDLTADDEW